MTGSPKRITTGKTFMRHKIRRALWVAVISLLALAAAYPGILSRLQGFPPSSTITKHGFWSLLGWGSTTGRPSLSFVLDPILDPDENLLPKLVWLMSFPNSGTSFTMMSVLRASNYSTASNYGDEVTAKGDLSLPVYRDRPEGPFWPGMSGKLGAPRPLPDNYVLVKTHCGSRCVACGPGQYVQTVQEFVDDCRRASARVGPKRVKLDYYYSTDRIHKAIHLVRHPITNMISRFHQDSKNFHYKNRDKWISQHPNNASGFRRWCRDLDEKYQGDESAAFSRLILPDLRMTPCHAELYRYIQWHNHAFETTTQLSIPSLLIHYEDYETNFAETFPLILNFLELPQATSPSKEFSARHDYHDYFASNETDRIRQTAKMLASNATWNAIQKYF